MKKILLMLLVSLLSFQTIFAQDTSGDDMDMAALLEMLKDDDAVANQDLSDFTQVLNDNPELSGEIQTQLEDSGLDQSTIDSTMTIVNQIENGDISTLGESSEYENVKEGIVEAVAAMAVEQVLGGDDNTLSDSIKSLKGALGSLSEFGQANALTSVGGSLFGYQGYKLFALSLGTTVSLASDMDTLNTVLSLINSDDAETELETKLKNDGFAVGVSIQGINANVGINLNWLIDRLYGGVVFGATNVEIDSKDGLTSSVLGADVYSDPDMSAGVDGLNASISTKIFGVTANYQLIKPLNIPILFRWNGINVGSGFIYTGYNINAKADISELLAEGDVAIDPGTFVGVFDITSNAVTIPMEISTGVRLLSTLNISFGLGADIQMGSSAVTFDLQTNNPDSMGTKILTAVLNGILESEKMSFPYNNPGDIQFINPKAMIGVGIGLGPLTLLDLSVTGNITPAQTLGLVASANLVVRW